MSNSVVNQTIHRDFMVSKGDSIYRLLFILSCGLFCLITIFSCGGKKQSQGVQKKIEITVTGLDGNGVAEKKITDDLIGIEGIKTISFNYLSNQVVVLYDTTKVTQNTIISIITKSNEGKHKILDIKENKEPLENTNPDVKPDKQEDIQDDVENQNQNSG